MNKEQPIEEKLDRIAEYVCDNLCKIPVNPTYNPNTVEKFCKKCRVNSFVNEFKESRERFYRKIDELYLAKCREVNTLVASCDGVMEEGNE